MKRKLFLMTVTAAALVCSASVGTYASDEFAAPSVASAEDFSAPADADRDIPNLCARPDGGRSRPPSFGGKVCHHEASAKKAYRCGACPALRIFAGAVFALIQAGLRGDTDAECPGRADRDGKAAFGVWRYGGRRCCGGLWISEYLLFFKTV